jgi:hypothetical protein
MIPTDDEAQRIRICADIAVRAMMQIRSPHDRVAVTLGYAISEAICARWTRENFDAAVTKIWAQIECARERKE